MAKTLTFSQVTKIMARNAEPLPWSEFVGERVYAKFAIQRHAPSQNEGGALRTRTSAKKAVRDGALDALLSRYKTRRPALPARVTITLFSPRAKIWDGDNAIARAKPVRDAVAQWLGCDDREGSGVTEWLVLTAETHSKDPEPHCISIEILPAIEPADSTHSTGSLPYYALAEPPPWMTRSKDIATTQTPPSPAKPSLRWPYTTSFDEIARLRRNEESSFVAGVLSTYASQQRALGVADDPRWSIHLGRKYFHGEGDEQQALYAAFRAMGSALLSVQLDEHDEHEDSLWEVSGIEGVRAAIVLVRRYNDNSTNLTVHGWGDNETWTRCVPSLWTSGYRKEPGPAALAAQKGGVFVILAEHEGLTIKTVDRLSEPLVRANYSQPTLDAFDRVATAFDSEKPAGRLVVLSGPPGTGKTHWIRGMIAVLHRARCLVIPTQMLSRITGPELIPTLMRSTGRPMVLILEDADDALAPRFADNIADISALLNLADGLFGAALDLRILATTNASAKDIDPAIIRAGRLLERVDFAPFSEEDGVRWLCEQGGIARMDDARRSLAGRKSHTLAQLYEASRIAAGSIRVDRGIDHA